MRALFDINFIIALLDSDHAFHDRAHAWWAANASRGWASCPITENGVVRIMSHPGYSSRVQLRASDLISRVQRFAAGTDHEFWPDDISIRDGSRFAAERIHSGKQLTDIYLLELAANRGGRLVTFDAHIPSTPARHAARNHLCVV